MVDKHDSPPRETYTKYAANEPFYSMFNNDYGMDLAWNYIPSDLDRYISTQDDFRLTTGDTCNNVLALGPERKNVLRELATELTIDELVLHRVDAAGNHVDFPLNLNLIHSLELFPDLGDKWLDTFDGSAKISTHNAALIRNFGFTPYHFAFYIRYTLDLKVNANIDLDAFLSRKMQDSYAVREEYDFLWGNDTDKPTGLLRLPRRTITPTTATAEQPRANTRTLTVMEVEEKTRPELFAEDIVRLVYALPPVYLPNASFLMHPLTLVELRLLPYFADYQLDANGRELLCGRPVHLSMAMPTPANTEDVPLILFGDFKAAYNIIDFGPVDIHDMGEDEIKLLVRNPLTRYHESYVRYKLFSKKVLPIVKDENALIGLSLKSYTQRVVANDSSRSRSRY